MNNELLLMRANRLTKGIECLELIKEFLIKNSDIRLEQLLFILDNQEDYFNEEPEITFDRWKNRINEVFNHSQKAS